MRALVFQLVAPMAAFGDIAVGERRGSFERPSKSGVLGLLAAALGYERADEAAHAALASGLAFAVATLDLGRPLSDYHTTQTASEAELRKLKKAGRTIATRADELAVGKRETILSQRTYRIGAAHLVALLPRDEAFALDALAQALRRPHFVLYLGRKSCPPALPLDPAVVEGGDVASVFACYLRHQNEKLDALVGALQSSGNGADRSAHSVAAMMGLGHLLATEGPKRRAVEIAHDGDLGLAPTNGGTLRQRRDHPTSRRRWHFAPRSEVVFKVMLA